MTNEEKAREIAESYHFIDGETLNDDAMQCRVEDGCLQAMQWKDEQLIDRLEDWLANNICNAYNFRGDDISATFMNDCIKAIKGD